ncbi:MAG: hypothetical protein APR55_10525 [Methanolinea sp. SDB]|nr:MAG: hypothetical protein APR55_10525 [Methanolinea sp. SDB]
MLVLPEDKRHYFKSPFGRLLPSVRDVIPGLDGRIIYSVGDVVTYYLIQNGIIPDVAVIDGHTMREPCKFSPAVFSRRMHARNPPGTITREMVRALHDAVNKEPPVLIIVEGEEDLAVIPLVICSPEGAVILYGQPGEGVVVCEVDWKARKKARELLSYFIFKDENTDK